MQGPWPMTKLGAASLKFPATLNFDVAVDAENRHYESILSCLLRALDDRAYSDSRYQNGCLAPGLDVPEDTALVNLFATTRPGRTSTKSQPISRPSTTSSRSSLPHYQLGTRASLRQNGGPSPRCLAVQVLGDVQPGAPGGPSFRVQAHRRGHRRPRVSCRPVIDPGYGIASGARDGP